MKLVILDRDGVINHDSPSYIKSPDEWRPLPRSLDAIAWLTQADYHIAVATNQAGVGRGLFEMATLNAIHDKMHKAVAQAGGRIDAIFYCPHPTDASCSCRKPKSGMFEEIGRRFNTKLDGVPCIGDSLRDLQAATAVGGLPILVLTGKGAETRRGGGLPTGTRIHADLAEAVKSFLK